MSLAGYAPLIHKIRNAVFSFKHKIWKGVSDETKDLITKLLVSDPTKQLNITETLRHPWLQDEIVKKKALDLIHED